ncbi:MAG: rod shape-determining protein RodA [Gemmatimonadota bacterium]
MRLAREYDQLLIAGGVLLTALGVTMIYSAASGSALWWSQTGHALFALVVAAAIVQVPDKLFYGLAYAFHGVSLLTLVAVLAWGTGDPARWLTVGGMTFQPAEFTKVTTVMALARYLGDIRSEHLLRPQAFLVSLAICAAPMALVAKQPDLGTAVAFGAPLFPMLYWAGMRPLHIFYITAPLLSIVFSFEPLWQGDAAIVFALFILASSVAIQLLQGRLWLTLTLLAVNLSAGLIAVYGWVDLLRDYQKARILTFLNPERDTLGAGWNIIQSKIAIGSGGLLGKGYLEGTQTKYEFLPAAHTDFIFSVIGEELGFVGVVAVLALFFFLIWRALSIGTMANNRFYGLLAIGLAATLTFHVFVNVGMTIGVMPVTGLPLPFLSYGGSALLTNWMAVGLLLHAFANRHEY